MGNGDPPAEDPPAAAGPVDSVEWIRSAVSQFERPLTSYAAHLLGDVERARDVVQEAFFRLCGKAEADLGSRVAEWLFTVCRNLSIDVRRKERRMNLLGEGQAETYASQEPEPAEAVEQEDSIANVLRLMARLPVNQQEAIRLKFQHGLSYKQISEVTGLSVSNVGFLIHTGLKNLRRRLGEPPRTGANDPRGMFDRG